LQYLSKKGGAYFLKNKKLIIFGSLITSIVALLAVVIIGDFFRTEAYVPSFPYIATLNGIPIPLDEYKIYLREEVLSFEFTGGPLIWRTDFSGVPASEVAKNNAL